MAGKISIKYVETKSGWRWRVRWRNDRKDERRFFHKKTEAEAEAKNLRQQREMAGAVWLSLTASERNNLIHAYEHAKRLGVDIHEAIRLASKRTVLLAPNIERVIQQIKTAKQNSGCCMAYVRNLGIVLNQFARGRESMPIDQFQLSDVESFLDAKKLTYRRTLRGKLSTLFNFAVRRGYRTDNPCNRLEPIRITKLSPSIFTVVQFKTAAEWLVKHHPSGLAWFALSTLCGLRPEEAEKTTKSDIHFEEGFVKVDAQTTKVRQRRVVYPLPQAMAFLKWATDNGGVLPICHESRRQMISGYRRKHGGLRTALGFKAWPKDITRHTAASYWLASGVSAGVVSEMLGNSERILKRDYKALVTRAQADEFWKTVAELAKC